MDLFLFGVALATLIMTERMPRLRFQASPFFRSFFLSDLWYLATGGILLALAMRGQALLWAGIFGESISRTLADAPFALTVGLAIILYDLGAYVLHTLLHRIDMLWELHKVHHSSRTLDWLATFRAHILEHTLRNLISPVLLILLGFPLTAVAMASAVYGVWAALNHANVRLPLSFLEPLLITPRLHRLHHVSATGERNLGTIFSVWDRLRGTLETSPTALLQPTGVPGAVETYPQTWLRQLTEPFTRRTVSKEDAYKAAA
jgi:sterol desaturase/sphingolipid hydroxylase (fatty acid hydroxylase superfamily)